jgi:hypothetical protein
MLPNLLNIIVVHRYEIVDDGQLQDEPVHFKVMDKDEWTAE